MSRENFISENLTNMTMRIETFTRDVKPLSFGTGFYFNFIVADGLFSPAIVTNKHVFENANKAKFKLNVLNDDMVFMTGQAKYFQAENIEANYIFHPDDDIDLCILPFKLEHQQGGIIFNAALNNSNIAAIADLGYMEAVEDILMIGYPNGLWDEHNNLPLYRRGVTATHPGYRYNNRDEFVIDCACFPGSSGSPVIYYNFKGKSGSEFETSQNKLLLMGILYAGPQHSVRGNIVGTGQEFRAMIPNNFGYVIKAEKLLDFIPLLKKTSGLFD